MGFSLGGSGFFTKSEAESKEVLSSDYKKTVKTPEAMKTPAWVDTMVEEFMRNFYGADYYDQISKEPDKKTKAIIAKHERLSKSYGAKAEQYKVIAENQSLAGEDNTAALSNANRYASLRDQMDAKLSVYDPKIEEQETPYEKSVNEMYADVLGKRTSVSDYMEEMKGVVPDATESAMGKYSELLSQIIDRSLTGESVMPQIGLPDTGFAGLLDRLTSPVSIGLEGHGGMSFVPKGAAEALKEVFAGRQSAIDQLSNLGYTRTGTEILPAEVRYQAGLAPKEYELDTSMVLPKGGELLQQLAGMRDMWAPVQESAMHLGAQVPLIRETESTDAFSKASSDAFGTGGSGSASGGQ